MTISIKKASEAMNNLQCLLMADYPDLADMSLIEIEYPAPEVKEGQEKKEASSVVYFYSREQIKKWIDTNKEKGCVCNNPKTSMPFGVDPEIKPARQLFTLTLAAVIASGHFEALKKEDDVFATFVEQKKEEYEQALKEGNEILENLKLAPGATLKEKLIALNLPEIKGTKGEMQFLESILGLQDLFVDQKTEDEAVLNAILKFKPAAQPVPIADQRNWADRIIDEINAPAYVGKGFPLGRGTQNRHEQKTMQFVQHISDPELLAELLERVTAIATRDKNVACLTADLQTKLLAAYLEMPNRDVNLIYRGIDALAHVLKQVPAWSAVKEDSLRPYLQSMEQFFSVVGEPQKWAELFLNLCVLKTEMLRIHAAKVFPNAEPKRQILPGKAKAVDVVIKNGKLEEKSKMQGFIDFANERIAFVYREHMKNLEPEILKVLGSKLMALRPFHQKDTTRDYMDAIITTYEEAYPQEASALAIKLLTDELSDCKLKEEEANVEGNPVRFHLPPERENLAVEMILGGIEALESAMRSGRKEAVEEAELIKIYGEDRSASFNKEELDRILGRLTVLEALSKNEAEMHLDSTRVMAEVIKPCQKLFKAKLRALSIVPPQAQQVEAVAQAQEAPVIQRASALLSNLNPLRKKKKGKKIKVV